MMNYYPFTLDWFLHPIITEQNRNRRLSAGRNKPHRIRRPHPKH